MLDLTNETIDEKGLLFHLKKSFDEGRFVEGVYINSDSALKLYEANVLTNSTIQDAGTLKSVNFYSSPFGTVKVIPKRDDSGL